MGNKTLKTVFVSFRVTQDEFDCWKKARKDKGFKSRSALIRECVNAALSNSALAPTCLTREEIVHLKRTCAALTELTVLVAANDNALEHAETEERLHEALNHVMTLKK